AELRVRAPERERGAAVELEADRAVPEALQAGPQRDGDEHGGGGADGGERGGPGACREQRQERERRELGEPGEGRKRAPRGGSPARAREPGRQDQRANERAVRARVERQRGERARGP